MFTMFKFALDYITVFRFDLCLSFLLDVEAEVDTPVLQGMISGYFVQVVDNVTAIGRHRWQH